ncbi:MAG: hypothetical protein ABIR32_18615 [Ilumatobacteraceae bacterium]
MSFRDRFFTPKVFKAIWSPISLGLLAVVTAVGIVLGLPIGVAIGIGLVAYAARIGVSMSNRDRSRRIDPFVLSEPWRRHVQSALSAKGRFDRTVRATSGGPIKDRLVELEAKLDGAVNESWRIAVKGDEIDAALGQLNPQRADAELQRLRADTGAHAAGTTVGADHAAAIASLEATIASGQRMQAVSTSTRGQLELLDTRLEELVARAAEVSIGTGDGGVLGNDVDDLVTSLEGLRLALEESNNNSAPAVRFDLPTQASTPAPERAAEQAPEAAPVEKPQTRPRQ